MIKMVGLEYRKLTTARGAASVLLTSFVVLAVVAAAGPFLAANRDHIETHLATSMILAALPLTIICPVSGILIMTMDWQHRDMASILVAAPSRSRLYFAKVVSAAALSVAFATTVVITNLAVAALIGGGQPGEGDSLTTSILTVLALSFTSTLAGSAIASVLLSLPLALVFVLLQTLILDPALSFWTPWGAFLQGSTAASALIGEASALEGLSSGFFWIVIPLALGYWRNARKDAG